MVSLPELYEIDKKDFQPFLYVPVCKKSIKNNSHLIPQWVMIDMLPASYMSRQSRRGFCNSQKRR